MVIEKKKCKFCQEEEKCSEFYQKIAQNSITFDKLSMKIIESNKFCQRTVVEMSILSKDNDRKKNSSNNCGGRGSNIIKSLHKIKIKNCQKYIYIASFGVHKLR